MPSGRYSSRSAVPHQQELLQQQAQADAIRSIGRAQAKVLRQASQSLKAGDLERFYLTMAVASFREAPVSVTLARPQDADCPLIGVSEGFEQMTGYSRSEIVGKNCRFLSRGCVVPPEDRHAMRIAVRTGRRFVGVLNNRRKNGEAFKNLLVMNSIRIGSSAYILGIQADVTHADVDLQNHQHQLELENVINAIFEANVDAWATLESVNYSTAKLARMLPYAQSILQPSKGNEQYIKARNTFVSLESDLLQNHFMSKNTFLEVYSSEEDPVVALMGLRRVSSEPALTSKEVVAMQASQHKPLFLALPTRGSQVDPLYAWDVPPMDRPKCEVDGDTAVDTEASISADADGDQKSVGSAGHPYSCTPCSFFCYSLVGCNRGKACQFCHMDHPKKGRRRGRKRRDLQACRESEVEVDEVSKEPSYDDMSQDAHDVFDISAAKLSTAPTQVGLLPLLSALECLAPLPALKKGDVRSVSSSSTASSEAASLEYRETAFVLGVGQWKTLLPFVSGTTETLRFSVQPPLPMGLELDPRTGVITGVGGETTPSEGSMHTVFGVGQNTAVSTKIGVLVVDMPAETDSSITASPWTSSEE